MLDCLRNDENASVRLPNEVEIQTYQQEFSEKSSLLHDVFAVADGLKLYLQQSGDAFIQNVFSNGWRHKHHVGNVLLFAPDGTVIA